MSLSSTYLLVVIFISFTIYLIIGHSNKIKSTQNNPPDNSELQMFRDIVQSFQLLIQTEE